MEKERHLKTNLKILCKINSEINASVNQDVILDRILEAATDSIGFEFATIQLADEAKNIIWTEKGRNNSTIDGALDPKEWGGELWGGLAKHPLNPSTDTIRDIHAWVLQKIGKEIVIKGPNDHFDKKIYIKYHHENLIRAFVPIIAYSDNGDPLKIGTLEAGHNIERKDVVDDTELEMLKALANQAAIAINNSRTHKKMKMLLQKEVEAEKNAVWKEVAKEVPHKIGTTFKGIEIDLRNFKKSIKICNVLQDDMVLLLKNVRKIYVFSRFKIMAKSLRRPG